MSKKHQEVKDDAVAVQEPAPLAKIDFAADLETFHDEFDRSALQIPFYRIIQSNSPIVKRGEPSYDEKARAGMFVNTVTRELFNQLEVIPVYHYSTFIEWRPRSEGGGFVKDHGFDGGMALLPTCKKRKNDKGEDTNRDALPNGNDLIRTEVYFILVVGEDGSLNQGMITMVSTQLKKARNWNSRHRMKVTEIPGQGRVAGAPMFFNTYKLSTGPEKNNDGSWEGYIIDDGRPTLSLGEAAYLAARDFRKTCEEGIQTGKINLQNAQEEPANKKDEDIPF